MRDSQNIAESVRGLADPIVRALNLELVDVELMGQGVKTLVRVTIDKPGGVTLHDCEQVHLSLSRALDVEDPIPHAYTLEVSSPGLDRPLKRQEDYRRSIGKLVSLKLRFPIDGQWRLIGHLLGTSEQGVTLAVTAPGQKKGTISIEWDKIAEGRLEVEF